ncbi:ribulose-phosphate 3-epimerase [Patescibacteria group bacterium]
MKIEILPTILTNSEDEALSRLTLLKGKTEWIQVDVIDGKFAKNVTLSASEFPKRIEDFSIEAQLMVQDPAMFIQDWYQRGAKRIIIHIESAGNIKEHIESVKKLGIKVGIGVNLETPIQKVTPYLTIIDRILFLSVKAGFSGQKFHDSVLPRIAEIRSAAPFIPIEVDGGINPKTATLARGAGATAFAVNSFLYSSPDPIIALEEIRKSVGL